MLFSDQKKDARILIIGDVMLDQYVSGKIERISPEAPVPVLLEEKRYSVPGGAANVAANVAALGANVRLMGIAGEDLEGHLLQTLLENLSFPENALSKEEIAAGAGRVNLSGLILWEGRSTTVKTRLLSSNQQIVRLDREQIGVFPDFICQKLIHLAAENLEWADIIVFSDYQKGTLEGGIFQKIALLARQAGKQILVDPKKTDFSFYQGASLLTPNMAELSKAAFSTLKTEEDVQQALAFVAEKSGADILLTRSAEGMSLYKKGGEAVHFPAHIVEVADVSGAGDTVLATIAVMLARGALLEDAVKIAIEAASLAVSRHGTAQVTLRALREKILQEKMPPAVKEISEGCEDFAPIFEKSEKLQSYCDSLKAHQKRLVFTNGCFDVLHLGHLRLLQKAAALGDYLIVGINTDASVKKLKGPSRPLQSQAVRASALAALRWVDMVVLFDEQTPLEILKKIRPDIVVKGGDYRPEEVVATEESQIFIFPLEEGYSTTSFYQNLLEKHQKLK